MRTVIDLVLLAMGNNQHLGPATRRSFIMGIAGLVAIIVSLYAASLVSSAFSYEGRVGNAQPSPAALCREPDAVRRSWRIWA
ncbi:MAG: hypothetical protein ACLTSG_15525 [Lachnospiraceae bacterium]